MGAAPDLTGKTDEELDDLYQYLLGQHREAIGENQRTIHDAIMWTLAEYSRRTDEWLAARV